MLFRLKLPSSNFCDIAVISTNNCFLNRQYLLGLESLRIDWPHRYLAADQN